MGLGNLISGICAHVSSNVIMAKMASLLTMLDSRYIFSQKFNYIFITQIQDYPDEKVVQFQVQHYKKQMDIKKNGWIYSIMM